MEEEAAAMAATFLNHKVEADTKKLDLLDHLEETEIMSKSKTKNSNQDTLVEVAVRPLNQLE